MDGNQVLALQHYGVSLGCRVHRPRLRARGLSVLVRGTSGQHQYDQHDYFAHGCSRLLIPFWSAPDGAGPWNQTPKMEHSLGRGRNWGVRLGP